MSMRPGLGWVATLVLASCGGDAAPARPCDRLGLLCAADDGLQPLGLDDSRNVSADLDADGVLDLVTAAGPAGLSISWGHTDTRDYHLPGPVPDARIGDIDRDGRPDLVYVTSDPPALHVLLATGTRALKDGPTQPLAGRPQGLWLGHLDADDRLDAVVAGSDEGSLTVLTDDLGRATPITVGRELVAVDVGDFDRDDRLDLVALDRSDASFYLVLADGDGFGAPRRVATGPGPRYLQLLDHDGDGHTDVLTHGQGPEIWFHAGDGAGSFSPARPLVIQTEPSAGFGARRDAQGQRWLYTIDAGNLAATRLGDDDRVAGRIRGGGVFESLGLDMDADGVLTHGPWFGQRFALTPAQVFSERWRIDAEDKRSLTLVDFDADGVPELIALDGPVATVYQQQADATWAEWTRIASDQTISTVVAADVTGDGRPDLVFTDSAPALRLAIAGDGSFTVGPPTPLSSTYATPYPVRLPGGGATDIVTVQRFDEQLRVYTYRLTGDQFATTDTESLLPVPGDSLDLAVADLDADGGDDLVALVGNDDNTQSLIIVPATADGWGPARTRALDPILARAFVLGDLDQDGSIDAALLASGSIVRLMDLAADPPPPPQIVEDIFSDYASSLAIADADADGRPDLAVCGQDGLAIILATDDGGWLPQPPYDAFPRDCALHVDPDLQPIAVLAEADALTILTPEFAPALAAADYLDGGPASFARVVTGDLDADGRSELVLGTSGLTLDRTPTGSTAAVFFDADGHPRRAVWNDGEFNARAVPALAPLDDRPGDELILAWANDLVEIWTVVDGALVKASDFEVDLWSPLAVGTLARAHGPSDLLFFGLTDGDHWSVLAVPRAADGTAIADAPVTLASGPIGLDPPDLTIADFDTDGYDDIVVTPGRGPIVVFVWGDKPRVASQLALDGIPGDVLTAAHADMDADGRPELIFGTTLGVYGHKFTGRDPGPRITFLDEPATDGLLVADLEGDGHADLLRVTDSVLDVTLRGPGDDEQVQLPFAPAWQPLRAAHLDDDDILDLVGLQDGNLVTRLSAARSPESP